MPVRVNLSAELDVILDGNRTDPGWPNGAVHHVGPHNGAWLQVAHATCSPVLTSAVLMLSVLLPRNIRDRPRRELGESIVLRFPERLVPEIPYAGVKHRPVLVLLFRDGAPPYPEAIILTVFVCFFCFFLGAQDLQRKCKKADIDVSGTEGLLQEHVLQLASPKEATVNILIDQEWFDFRAINNFGRPNTHENTKQPNQHRLEEKKQFLTTQTLTAPPKKKQKKTESARGAMPTNKKSRVQSQKQ